MLWTQHGLAHPRRPMAAEPPTAEAMRKVLDADADGEAVHYMLLSRVALGHFAEMGAGHYYDKFEPKDLLIDPARGEIPEVYGSTPRTWYHSRIAAPKQDGDSDSPAPPAEERTFMKEQQRAVYPEYVVAFRRKVDKAGAVRARQELLVA